MESFHEDLVTNKHTPYPRARVQYFYPLSKWQNRLSHLFSFSKYLVINSVIAFLNLVIPTYSQQTEV